jgi:hypothetical protein
MWIIKILFRGYMGVTINNVEGQKKFQTDKSLRQGDPLSPILFNLVVDVLSRMLCKASSANLIRGMGVILFKRV